MFHERHLPRNATSVFEDLQNAGAQIEGSLPTLPFSAFLQDLLRDQVQKFAGDSEGAGSFPSPVPTGP